MKYLENASSKLTNFCSQDVLNFTFILTKPEDGQWGALQPDGSWTGMVKLLQDHDLDIAVTDFTGESTVGPCKRETELSCQWKILGGMASLHHGE